MSAGPAGPPLGAGPLPGPRLSGPQQVLYDALLRKSPLHANMYLGALYALDQRANPDRFALCAHGLRELLEKLHKIVDIPVPVMPPSQREEVQRMKRHWDKYKGKWDTDNPMFRDKGFRTDTHGLLRQLERFFTTIEEIMPKRKDEARKVLRGLDPAAHPLAPALEERLLGQLEGLRGYFQGVAHHTRDASEGVFQEHLMAAETFLLERFAPRTYDEFARIDDIIVRGKSDAES